MRSWQPASPGGKNQERQEDGAARDNQDEYWILGKPGKGKLWQISAFLIVIAQDPCPEEDAAVLLSCNNDQSGVSSLSHDSTHQPIIMQGQKTRRLGIAEKRPGKKIRTNYQYAKVDRFFLFFSPFLFLIFNTIYWGYFLLWDKLLCKEEGSQWGETEKWSWNI